MSKANNYVCDTIYVYNIPERVNKIDLLFKHFKRYGHIKSIWCSGKIATVTYTSVDEAKNAYHGPEAYQNNRFVMIRYHRNPKESENNLHNAADMDKVKRVATEVKAAIEESEKQDQEFRNKMARQNELESITVQIQKNNDKCSQYMEIAKTIFGMLDNAKDESTKEQLNIELLNVRNKLDEMKAEIAELEQRKAKLNQQ